MKLRNHIFTSRHKKYQDEPNTCNVLAIHPQSLHSPIQTITVGNGLSPFPPEKLGIFQDCGLSPPAGNFALPREKRVYKKYID